VAIDLAFGPIGLRFHRASRVRFSLIGFDPRASGDADEDEDDSEHNRSSVSRQPGLLNWDAGLHAFGINRAALPPSPDIR